MYALTRTGSLMSTTCPLSYTIQVWAKPIEKIVKKELLTMSHEDGSHDMGHFQRVSALSTRFAKEEKGNELIAYVAGMMHDIVNLPKNHPDVKNCSFLASERAKVLLNEIAFPKELIPDVCHAIHAHSFSANVEPKTVEAKCVQDADRMEALGAFGLMRVFYTSGKLGAKIMEENDPLGKYRKLNDKAYALDHFQVKLLTLAGTMKTEAGKMTAESLSLFLEEFRNRMISDRDSGCLKIAEVYHQAGQKNISLFHLEDPFADSRNCDLEKYALDQLLHCQEPYVYLFLKQLKFELNGYRD